MEDSLGELEKTDLPQRRGDRGGAQRFLGEAKRGVAEDAEGDAEGEKKDWRSEI